MSVLKYSKFIINIHYRVHIIRREFIQNAFLFEEGEPPHGGGRSCAAISKLPQSRIRSTAPSEREPFL